MTNDQDTTAPGSTDPADPQKARPAESAAEAPAIPVDARPGGTGRSSDRGAHDRDLFLDDEMPSTHWSVPWSDIMLVLFVLFAVMYTYLISHRDIAEAFKKQQPAAATVPRLKDPFEARNLSAPGPDASRAATMEELYKLIQSSVTVSQVEQVTVALDQNNTIKVSISEPLLFDLGRAELRPASKAFLDKFADIMRTTKNRIIIEGHTDSLPISTDAFPTNWELSAVRAARVARYLIENAGLKPERFSITGYSLYKPVSQDGSREGKARNRRVEVVITREQIE